MTKVYLTRYSNLQYAKDCVLGQYSHSKGENYTVEYLPNGAPQLFADGVASGCVSISHTDGMLAMAFSDGKVGVDIELSDRQVSRKICDSIAGWTRIEAYAKWTGSGLTRDIIFSQLPQDIIYTYDFGQYVISVCSLDGDIELLQI